MSITVVVGTAVGDHKPKAAGLENCQLQRGENFSGGMISFDPVEFISKDPEECGTSGVIQFSKFILSGVLSRESRQLLC